MKNNKRDILKQLLTGQLSSKKAVSQLKKELDPHRGFWVFHTTSESGLYSGNGYTDITEDEAKAIAGDDPIFLMEHVSVVIPGTENTVIILPDNGRSNNIQ